MQIYTGDSQTFPLLIFPEGGGTSVHRLHRSALRKIAKDTFALTHEIVVA